MVQVEGFEGAKAISFPNCSTHLAANASSVKRLLEARARIRMANVSLSDIERATVKPSAYWVSVLAWKPNIAISPPSSLVNRRVTYL